MSNNNASSHIEGEMGQESERTRRSADGSEDTVQKDTGVKTSSTPPPPYAECSPQIYSEEALSDGNTSYPVLTEFAKEDSLSRRTRLHWILVEIVAVTFSTDLQRLKLALIKTDHLWAQTLQLVDSSSIMDDVGRALVAELCALVQNLEKEMTRNRWLLIHPRDKSLVIKMVLKPVEEYRLDLAFVLELLGRFNRDRGCRGPESTLLDYWKTSPRTTDLGDILASHALLLKGLKLREEVRRVMEEDFAAFLRDNRLEELCTSRGLQEASLLPGPTYCWPLSGGYMELARGLKASKTSNKFLDLYKQSRRRLSDILLACARVCDPGIAR
jgi:hypothetical protein